MDITVQKNRGFLQSMLCLYTRPQYFKSEDSALIMDFVFNGKVSKCKIRPKIQMKKCLLAGFKMKWL